jgi:ATP-dependent Clp protease ATP-binding subunit ClpB
VLAALLDQDGGTVRPAARPEPTSTSSCCARNWIEALDRLPRVEGGGGDVQISNALSRLLNLTDKLAQQRKDAYISSELFVLAALEDKANWASLLHKAGATKAS